jgi:hypothetical protein
LWKLDDAAGHLPRTPRTSLADPVSPQASEYSHYPHRSAAGVQMLQKSNKNHLSFLSTRSYNSRPLSEATEILDTDFEAEFSPDDNSPRRSVDSVSNPKTRSGQVETEASELTAAVLSSHLAMTARPQFLLLTTFPLQTQQTLEPFISRSMRTNRSGVHRARICSGLRSRGRRSDRGMSWTNTSLCPQWPQSP